MNNALFTAEEVQDPKVSLRQKESQLTEIIDAIQNIAGSNLWKVLQNNVFDVELVKSKRRLENESDTTEMFRLQGEVRLGRRYQLDKLLTKYRNELQAIRKQINE